MSDPQSLEALRSRWRELSRLPNAVVGLAELVRSSSGGPPRSGLREGPCFYAPEGEERAELLRAFRILKATRDALHGGHLARFILERANTNAPDS